MTANTAPRRCATTLAAITLGLAVAIAPALADARAGSGKSSGSRGSQTYQAPPTTSTAPRTAAPMERSAAPQQVRPQPAMASPAAQARPGGLFGGGFGGALLGGLIGAGLFGLLFGHGLFGGMAGFGSILGLLMQAALIGGLIWLAVAFFRRRQQPAAAGMGHARTSFGGPMGGGPIGGGPIGGGPMGRGPAGGFDARAPGMGGGAPTGPARPAPTPIQIREGDYASFERLLTDVQDAWSRGDVGAMRALMTAEMAGYFVEEMNANTARGVQNRTERVRLVQGDLAEAWREGGEEYATVAMRFAHVDYSVDASGRVVEGSPDREVEATEVWTFVRPVGGSWMLSAIQQAG